ARQFNDVAPMLHVPSPVKGVLQEQRHACQGCFTCVRLGAAPGGPGGAVLKEDPLTRQLSADAVRLGEVAALLGFGAGGDEAVDAAVAFALEPSLRGGREEAH